MCDYGWFSKLSCLDGDIFNCGCRFRIIYRGTDIISRWDSYLYSIVLVGEHESGNRTRCYRSRGVLYTDYGVYNTKPDIQAISKGVEGNIMFEAKLKRERVYKVAVSDGVKYKLFTCENRYDYNTGFVYEYKDENKRVDMVLVPRGYKYGEVNGVLLIGKNAGNISAAELVFDEILIGKSTDKDAPGWDASLLYKNHVMAQGYKTLYEKNVPWKWLIIGIAVLVVVIGVVWFIRAQMGGG